MVMAVYNGERFLREAIDSILAQEYTDFELIIVDDGSTDRSREIIGSYQDARIVVVENKRNLGLARSLNRGLAVARGEYIARQDADDVSLPNRLSRQVAFLDARPSVALVGSAHAEIDDSGRVVREVDAHCEHTTIAWALLFFCPFVHSAVMFRRALVLENVGFYDPAYQYSMDFDLWARIAARYRVANLPEPLVRLRLHDRSMTSTFGDRTREGHRLRVREVARLLGHERRHEQALEALHARLSTLLFGPWSEVDTTEVPGTVAQVLRLQDAFARDQGLTPAEAVAHRYEVRQHTAQALFAILREAGTGSRASLSGRLRVAWLVLRLQGRGALKPGSVWSFARLLAALVRPSAPRRSPSVGSS
jgi:hypothetical protein